MGSERIIGWERTGERRIPNRWEVYFYRDYHFPNVCQSDSDIHAGDSEDKASLCDIASPIFAPSPAPAAPEIAERVKFLEVQYDERVSSNGDFDRTLRDHHERIAKLESSRPADSQTDQIVALQVKVTVLEEKAKAAHSWLLKLDPLWDRPAAGSGEHLGWEWEMCLKCATIARQVGVDCHCWSRTVRIGPAAAKVISDGFDAHHRRERERRESAEADGERKPPAPLTTGTGDNVEAGQRNYKRVAASLIKDNLPGAQPYIDSRLNKLQDAIAAALDAARADGAGRGPSREEVAKCAYEASWGTGSWARVTEEGKRDAYKIADAVLALIERTK